MFHILLPKQISSLGTGSGPVPTSPPPLFGTRFWQETNRKIAPEELCRSKFPNNRARSWQKRLHSGPPKRRKSHVLSRIFATFGLKKHKTHITGPDLEGPRGQIPYCCIADLDGTSVGRSGRRRGLPFRPYLHARISRITVVEQLPQIMILQYRLNFLIWGR